MHPLTPDCEAALALSAAPDYLRADAGVVLGKHGYEEIKPSANGYRCIVERNHEASLIPQCFDFNYIYAAGSGRMLKVAPHVMYHAPGLSNDDIGADPEGALQNPGLPLINAGGPHAFMIGFTRYASDSTGVLAACQGQLPADDGLTPFPASAD